MSGDGGNMRDEGKEITLGPSSLPVGLGRGAVLDHGERDWALKGRLKGVPGAAIPPFLRLPQRKSVAFPPSILPATLT